MNAQTFLMMVLATLLGTTISISLFIGGAQTVEWWQYRQARQKK